MSEREGLPPGSIRDLNLGYEAGSGEPLLLIHGLGANSTVWAPVVPLLARERRVIALDLAGFGAAPLLPDPYTPSPQNLAAILYTQCQALGAPRPHVAGNSLGAWVGLEMGRIGLAASVTALSPAGLWRKIQPAQPSAARAWGNRLLPLVKAGLAVRPLRHRALRKFVGHPERMPAAAGRDLIVNWLTAPGYAAANEEMRQEPFNPNGYPEDVPVTIAWGELDRLVGPPKPERRPAGARFLTLPGVGHTPMWDDPELVAHTLLEGSRTKERL